ncbi:MAG: acyltransferase [Saprospirales bacterium]|nr:acyltransferase [Saprospirales bacterium]
MKQRIEELDALRGFAALAVVFFHYTLENKQAGFHFNIGCMGVDMFFVISGFVIFMTIQKSKNWKAFLVSRFSRLYPAYWTCVSITALFLYGAVQADLSSMRNPHLTEHLPAAYVVNLTMFQHYFKVPDVDGSYWTLIVELVFYIFVLLVLAFRQINKLETFGMVCLVPVSLYAINPLAGHWLFREFQMLVPLVNYFPLFFGGIILYKMKFEKRTALRTGVFILTFTVQCLIFQHCYRNRFYLGTTEYVVVLFGIYALFFLFLYDRLAFIVHPVTTWLGKISYTLYLLHQVIGVYIIIPAMTDIFHWNFWPSAILAIGAVCLLAHWVNRFVEQPAMRYIREKSKPFIQ